MPSNKLCDVISDITKWINISLKKIIDRKQIWVFIKKHNRLRNKICFIATFSHFLNCVFISRDCTFDIGVNGFILSLSWQCITCAVIFSLQYSSTLHTLYRLLNSLAAATLNLSYCNNRLSMKYTVLLSIGHDSFLN